MCQINWAALGAVVLFSLIHSPVTLKWGSFGIPIVPWPLTAEPERPRACAWVQRRKKTLSVSVVPREVTHSMMLPGLPRGLAAKPRVSLPLSSRVLHEAWSPDTLRPHWMQQLRPSWASRGLWLHVVLEEKSPECPQGLWFQEGRQSRATRLRWTSWRSRGRVTHPRQPASESGFHTGSWLTGLETGPFQRAACKSSVFVKQRYMFYLLWPYQTKHKPPWQEACMQGCLLFQTSVLIF